MGEAKRREMAGRLQAGKDGPIREVGIDDPELVAEVEALCAANGMTVEEVIDAFGPRSNGLSFQESLTKTILIMVRLSDFKTDEAALRHLLEGWKQSYGMVERMTRH